MRPLMTLLICFICLSKQAYAELEPVTLQLKWLHQFQFAGYYAAKELGYYEEAGFDVTIVENNGAITAVESVVSGNATFGIGDGGAVNSRLNGQPIVIVSTVFQHSPLVFIALEESNIRSPLDLVGKRVMIDEGLDDATLSALFNLFGISLGDFEAVPNSYYDLELLNNTVDVMGAYLTVQPFEYHERNIPITIINPENYGVDFYGDLIFAHEDYVSENPERAEAFAKASLKGWAYALKNQKATIDLILNNYPTLKSSDQLKYEANATASMIQMDLIPLGSIYSSRFERIAASYKNLGLAPVDGSIEGLFLEDYLIDDQTKLKRLIAFIIAIMATLIVVCSILWFSVTRLKQRIYDRTHQLNITMAELRQKYSVIDRYLMAAEVDLSGKITYASQALCERSGYQADEIIGQPMSLFRHPDSKDDVFEINKEELLAGRSLAFGERKQITKDGQAFWVRPYMEPLFSDDRQTLTGFLTLANDITHKKQFEMMSETDSLTGLGNRAMLDRHLSEEWGRQKRYKEPFSVILFDVDYFKKINDEFGHLTGDKVLVNLSALAKTHIRDIDILGRWGGEEFLIICPNTRGTQAKDVAEKLRRLIENSQILTEKTITASFGVACSQNVAESASKVVQAADEALYNAKANGRNRVEANLS